MKNVSNQQSQFHHDLNAYINQCGHSRSDRIFSLIWPKPIFGKLAKSLSRDFLDLESRLPKTASSSLEISIQDYEGSDISVVKMMSGLEPIKNDLVGAYLHGSLATDEKINYSDFDAIVILKSSSARRPERLACLASKLNKLRQIMNQADPLQHHGWFVITELDLLHYCDAYFPTALFEFSKSLFKTHGQRIEVIPRDSQSEIRAAFDALSNAVIVKTQDSPPPGNLFELKSLLSQFMLLPALYIQAQKAQGVFKKHSFQMAKIDFIDESWEIMDRVSEIRQTWPAHNTGLRYQLLSRTPVLWRRWIIRLASPAIPDQFKRVLTRDFFASMAKLTESMRKNVERNHQNFW